LGSAGSRAHGSLCNFFHLDFLLGRGEIEHTGHSRLGGNFVPQIANDLLDKDVQLALQRFRGKATTHEMLRWINHEFRRGYQLQEFENALTKLVSFRDDVRRTDT
jgi:hypothetical protein